MNDVDPVPGMELTVLICAARNKFSVVSYRKRDRWRKRMQQRREGSRFMQRLLLTVHDYEHACTSSLTGTKLPAELSTRKHGQREVGANGPCNDIRRRTSSTIAGVRRNP